MTQVWFRNPLNCIRELAAEQQACIVWDRGLLTKKHVDAQRHIEANFPGVIPYRLLLVGDQGTAEIRRDSSFAAPTAVYPTWEYGSPIGELMGILENPPGESVGACSDRRIPADERPVLNQEHRVVVTRFPDTGTHAGRAFLREIAEIQDEFPTALIHLHGAYSYRVAFGSGINSADVDPHMEASKGRIILGNGKILEREKAIHVQQWVHLHNMSTTDLMDPKVRCRFNIRSAVWAGQYFGTNIKFKTVLGGEVDADSPVFIPTEAKSAFSQVSPISSQLPGDRIVCDSCSLTATCKYSRMGSVCTLPDSDGASLVRHFGTRDSDRIIEGLGGLVQMQVRRAERGIELEEEKDELDPEVTKIIAAATSAGIKLVKIIDPTLQKPNMNVQVNIGVAGQQAPNIVTSAAVAAIQARGVPLEEITQEMVDQFIMDEARKRQAIEVRSSGN